jgi:colicin import membrane protein
MRETARLRRLCSTAAGVAGVVLMAGYLVGAQGDTSAHDIAEKFAKAAAKPEALARKREAAEKRKASDERRKSDEAEMLARARAEAEARREEMLKAREAAELADTQRREQEEKAEVAARQAAAAKVAEERRQAEALRKAQEDQRLAEQRAAEIKRQEEARLQAEAQRRAEEEKRLAEIRRAEEEARMAALRRDEEVRVEATRQAEALRKAEEEHRLAEARRVAERAREQEQMAQASEQALRSRLEAERDLEGERLADRLSQARAQREARVTTDSSAVTPPRDVIEQGPSVGAEAAGLVLDPRTTRVTVLLLMLPGDRGIRRNNKSADPVLCGDGECYVSNGPAVEANLLPARKALGFLRTWGRRAGACNNSLVCVFRGVDLARLDRLLMPVDMRVVRHDRREMQEVAKTSTCFVERGRLACSDTIQSDDYMMWIVPESLAVKAGPEALQRALVDGLPTGRTALAPSRTF